MTGERASSARQRRIVVGVDDSAGARQALAFALEEARVRQTPLAVVHAWLLPLPVALPGSVLGGVPLDYDARADDLRAGCERLARELIETLLEEAAPPDDVEVEVAPVEGDAAAVLLAEAAASDLLVVGSRGRGGFSGLLLGSVSQACAHHAPCPVVIVRGPAGEAADQ